MKTIKQYKRMVCLMLASGIITMLACNKSNNFYKELDETPELALGDNLAYALLVKPGDTLNIHGRLNPFMPDFTVSIGGEKANIVGIGKVKLTGTGSSTYVHAKDSIDEIKVLITDKMGTKNVPVSITSAGQTISGPAITISAAGTSTTFTDTLLIAPYFNVGKVATDIIWFRCFNDQGKLYYFDGSAFYVVNNGQKTQIATKDFTGDTTFHISSVFSGTVDQTGTYLYFSGLCTDDIAGTDTYYIFRLCRIEVATGRLTVLNRTLLEKTATARRYASFYPQEGDLGNARLHAMRNMYEVDNKLYFCKSSVASLTTTASITISVVNLRDNTTSDLFVSNSVFTNADQKYYTVDNNGVVATTPTTAPHGGVALAIPAQTVGAVSGGLSYWYSASSSTGVPQYVYGYDLDAKARIYTLTFKYIFPSSAVLEGPFAVLGCSLYFSANYNTAFWPLPQDKILAFMPADPNQFASKYTGQLMVFDYISQQGYRYAPYVDYATAAATYNIYYKVSADANAPGRLLGRNKQGDIYLLGQNKTTSEFWIMKTEIKQ